MIQSNIKSATIYIDPPELGPIRVKIQQTADQTQITFQVNNAAVKEALEQSAHRLRDTLAEQNQTAVDVDVRRDNQNAESQAREQSAFAHGEGENEVRSANASALDAGQQAIGGDEGLPGLVNTYA